MTKDGKGGWRIVAHPHYRDPDEAGPPIANEFFPVNRKGSRERFFELIVTGDYTSVHMHWEHPDNPEPIPVARYDWIAGRGAAKYRAQNYAALHGDGVVPLRRT